jgi:hypothetical protein
MQCPNGPCGGSAGPANHLLAFNSMTFSGRLPPGPYQLELRVGNVETAVDQLTIGPSVRCRRQLEHVYEASIG